jgi:hypothetical protein
MKGSKVMDGKKTMSVPEAGRIYYGLSRGGSYAAADRGDLPTIQVGRLRRVPVRAMELKLDGAAPTRAETRKLPSIPTAGAR